MEPTPAPGVATFPPAITFGGPTTFFGAGSIIIPTGAAYQDDCGAVSAFGLVYDVLRAEDWLAANGHQRITIHYTYRSSKSSPNRCQPTNLDTPPSPSASATWNDGCDFIISGAEPVKLITNSNASSSSADTTLVTEDNNGTGGHHAPPARNNVWPPNTRRRRCRRP